jgi:hypothetical protein
MRRSANHAHGKPLQFIDREGEIATCERLVANLAIRFWLSASMTSVENLVATIFCILIPASQYNGIGSFVSTA